MIEIKNLQLGYKKDSLIIDGASFSIKEGNVSILLGKNGSGKSTIIKGVLSLLKNRGGEILIDGNDLNKLSSKERARHIAYVPQLIQDSSLNVLDMVMIGRIPYFSISPKKEDYEIVYKAMEELEIIHLANKAFSSLSGGEKQKVIIARALSQQAKLIVMDEPTSNLDIASKLLLVKMIKELAKDNNVSFLIAIHDVNEAMALGDDFIFLKEGKILYESSLDDLKEEYFSSCFDVKAKMEEIDGRRIVLFGGKYE